MAKQIQVEGDEHINPRTTDSMKNHVNTDRNLLIHRKLQHTKYRTGLFSFVHPLGICTSVWLKFIADVQDEPLPAINVVYNPYKRPYKFVTGVITHL